MRVWIIPGPALNPAVASESTANDPKLILFHVKKAPCHLGGFARLHKITKIVRNCAMLANVTEGFARIRNVTQGCEKFHKVSQGYARLRKVSQGCARLRKVAKSIL